MHLHTTTRPCSFGVGRRRWRPPVTRAHIKPFRCSPFANVWMKECLLSIFHSFYNRPLLLPSIPPQSSHSLTPSRLGLFLDSPDFTAVYNSFFMHPASPKKTSLKWALHFLTGRRSLLLHWNSSKYHSILHKCAALHLCIYLHKKCDWILPLEVVSFFCKKKKKKPKDRKTRG